MSTRRSRVTEEWKRQGKAFAVWLRERAMEQNLNSCDICIRFFGQKMRTDKPTNHARSRTISNWLTGAVKPQLKTLDLAALVFNVSGEEIDRAMNRDVSRARLMPIAARGVPRVQWDSEPRGLSPLRSSPPAAPRFMPPPPTSPSSPPARLELYRGVYVRAREPSDPENTIILEVLMNVPLAVADQISGILYQFYGANHVQTEPSSDVEPEDAPEPASETDAPMTDADREFEAFLDRR
jgi:hypothetical protein